jgi:hypothetical protein
MPPVRSRRPTPRASRTIPLGRPARRSTTTMYRLGRSKPHRSTGAKTLSALTGMVAAGTSSNKRSSRSKRKGAGRLALLAGAVGLAVKNRDRLTGMLGKRNDTPSDGVPPSPFVDRSDTDMPLP